MGYGCIHVPTQPGKHRIKARGLNARVRAPQQGAAGSVPCHVTLRWLPPRPQVRLFKPIASSGLQSFIGWLTGRPTEFSDPKFPAYGEGREVTK